MGGGNFSQGAATTGAKHDGLLFMHGVLEALTGAVAARLAAQETTNGNVAFTFKAGKNEKRGQQKSKGRKGKKCASF